MVRDAVEVLRDALALPAEARGALIDSLIDSLDDAVDDGAGKKLGGTRSIAVFSRSTVEPFSSYHGRTAVGVFVLGWSSD